MTAGPTPDLAFIEFVHRRRVVVGGVFIALAIVCLVVSGYCGFRGLKDQIGDAPGGVTLSTPEAASVELEPLPFRVGLVVALIAALGLGAVGAYFLGKVPDPNPDARRRTDRILLLVVGYVFGLANRLSGLFLFVYWFDKLTDWVSGAEGGQKTGWMPVAALLQYLLGAGVTFLAALPARAEERHHPWVRRAVYAVNFALSAVLLMVGLILVNAVVAMKLPEKLDTTSSGFYTLTEQTTEYIGGLKQKITAYHITTDLSGTTAARIQDDATRLLSRCQQVNPARFEVRTLSVTLDAKEIEELQSKYKAADLDELCVLLTTGPDGERFEQVPLRTMAKASPAGRTTFNGEAELVAGMMALTEERTTVYYTRGSGELALERPNDPTGAALTRPALALQDALAATQCEARPLVIDAFAADPKVPDDAGMVIVLDPTATLSPATVGAIQKYMTTPRPSGKAGKLLVFAGAHNTPAGDTVVKTGLEPLLAELGITLQDRVIYNEPVAERAPPDVVVVGATRGALNQRNPIALAAANGFFSRTARPLQVGGSGRASAEPVLGVVASGYTWLEKGVVDPPQKSLQDMAAAAERQDDAYFQQRQMSNRESRIVSAVATDAGKPVAAVFGFGDRLADNASQQDPSQTAVFKASLGWLRERPPAPDITPKEYTTYTPKQGVSDQSLFWVPVGGTLLAIVVLGLGVWAVRRK